MEKETMEHYRCFHCKQVFGPEVAADHFGKHTTDLPKCIQLVRTGAGGGIHDAYIRIRKDEFEKIKFFIKYHTKPEAVEDAKKLLSDLP